MFLFDSMQPFQVLLCTVEERQNTRVWIRAAKPRLASLVLSTIAEITSIAKTECLLAPVQSLTSRLPCQNVRLLAKINPTRLRRSRYRTINCSESSDLPA